jgi:hypothetical protein
LLKKCLLMTLLLGTFLSGSAYAEEGTNQHVKQKGTLEFFYIPGDLDALNKEKDILLRWQSNHPEISLDEIDLTQNFSDALKKGFLTFLTNEKIVPSNIPVPINNPYGADPNAEHYGNPAQDRAINVLPAVERAMNAAQYADDNAVPAIYAVGASEYKPSFMYFLLKDSDGSYLAQDRGNLSESDLDHLIAPTTENVDPIDANFFNRPYLEEVYGHYNHLATNTDTFDISLKYDHADTYRYRLDNGAWSEWNPLKDYDQKGYLTVSGIKDAGLHQIIVEIKNGANAITSKGSMTFFKL